MKRLIPVLLTLVLMTGLLAANALAAQTTVYLDPVNGADTAAGTEAAPVKTLAAAYALLQNTGGKLVLTDTLVLSEATVLPSCSYPVTITSKTGAEGISSSGHVTFAGETTLQNITLTLTKASTGTCIGGGGHKLTIGEDVRCVPFVNTTDSYYFCLQGGRHNGTAVNTDLTVKSGQFRNIYPGSASYTTQGNVNFTMTGGTAAVVSPSYSAGIRGSIRMTIGGTATVTTLYAGSWSKGNVSGDVAITLQGDAYIKNIFCAGNGAGNIDGTVTFTLDGYSYSGTLFKGKGNTSHTGTLGASRLVLKSGTLGKAPTDFGAVDIDIPAGKTLTLATTLAADTLTCAGTLNFSGAAALTVDTVVGSVNCTITGQTLKNQPYVTAPAGSAITFPPEAGITETNGVWVDHDLENFAGLVLSSDSANKVNLYGGIWAQGTGTTYTIVEPYATETLDGITYRYYPNAQGGYHVRASRSGYITLYKNIYMSAQEAAAKTVETVTLEKKGSAGFVPQTMYSHTAEVLDSVWKSGASMYPKYKDALVNPAFDEGRDAQQMTTQEEMEAMLAQADKEGDNMYVFSLGTSGEYGLNIPAVIFTENDLSSAATLEDAAALMDDHRVTVYYRAQMHGNEPAGTEGALAMIYYLQQGYGAKILDKINLIIVPRLSPDASQLYQRLLPSGVNPNRDQLRLESAEMQALQKGYLLFDPEIVLDGHERVWNNQAGDIQVSASFTPMNSDDFRSTALALDEAAFAELEANGLCGYYYAGAVNGSDPNMGSAYYASAGSIYVLMESRGIYGGNEAMERRAVAHMAAVTGMLDYLHENAAAVKTMITRERAAVAQKGAAYEADDLFVLDTNSRTTTAEDKETWGYLYTSRQTVDWGTGEVSFPERYPTISDVVARTRVAPTAYVIPADLDTIDSILSLMQKHGISYSYLPEGATLPLQRYGGDTAAATLGVETVTRFAQGCYVFTMNQEKALLLATLMEPDNANTAEFCGSLAQMELLSTGATYRYIQDLNANGFVDHTVTDASFVDITVYLDGTNGLDTNGGLTEGTAVKTLEQAYAIMEAAMNGASADSQATLVMVGLYDLGAKQSLLPQASYPVTITGKTSADGFKYTGGSSQATRTFEIQGPTTFQSMTIHINNTEAFNYFLANGHKLTIGEGMNFTTNKANCYFTLAGGSYDYTDKTASADITVRSGSWRTIYAGGYRASVTGTARADISGVWVYNNIAATYCGNVGALIMNICDTEVEAQSTSAIYVGPIEYNASNDVGAIQGDATVTLGKNVTARAVYTSSRTKGNIYGTATVIADGVDLSQLPIYALYPGTAGTTAAAVLKLNADVTQAVTLDAALPVDLNGHSITGALTVDGTLTVKDSQTDDFTVADGVYGKIAGTVTGSLQAAEGYVAVDGQSFHRISQRITGVAIRPSAAGMYYKAAWQCDEVLAQTVESFGIAASTADLPGEDFATDEDTLYTVMNGAAFAAGKEFTGALLKDILKAGEDNDARGKAPMHAIPYITFRDGTSLTGDGVSCSLYDVVHTAEEFAYSQKLVDFYTAWKDTMQSWNFVRLAGSAR